MYLKGLLDLIAQKLLAFNLRRKALFVSGLLTCLYAKNYMKVFET